MIETIILAATGSKLGIVVHTTNPDLLKRKLNATRKKLREMGEDYSFLKFRSSPTNPHGEVWIIKEEEKFSAKEIRS